jgi:hypothetical protein
MKSLRLNGIIKRFLGRTGKPVCIACLVSLLSFYACRKDDTPDPEPEPIWVEFVGFSDIHAITPAQQVFDIPVRLTGRPEVFPGFINYQVLSSAQIKDSTYTTTAINNRHYQIEQANIPFPNNALESFLRLSINFSQLAEHRLYSLVIAFGPGPFNIAEDPEKKHFVFNFYKFIPHDIQSFAGNRKGTLTSHWGGPYSDVELTFSVHEGDTMLVGQIFNQMLEQWGESWSEGPYPVKVAFSTAIPYLPSTIVTHHQHIGTTINQKQYWIKAGNEAYFSPQTGRINLDAFITTDDEENLVDHFRWESTN